MKVIRERGREESTEEVVVVEEDGASDESFDSADAATVLLTLEVDLRERMVEVESIMVLEFFRMFSLIVRLCVGWMDGITV